MNLCVEADNFDDLFRVALRTLVDHGAHASPRGIGVIEIRRPVVLVLTNIDRPFLISRARNPYYRFGLVETAWILSGSDSVEPLERFVPRMENFSDDGSTLWGAYGPRLITQLDHVLESLRKDTFTRQAVVTPWRPSEGALIVSKDIPCTVALHFQARDGRLDLRVFMRSNDVWTGLPYDVLAFTTIQRVVASAVGMVPGEYIHIADNLHLYDDNLKSALKVLDEPAPLRGENPTFPDICLFNGDDAKSIAKKFEAVFVAERPVHFKLQDFMAAYEKLRSPLLDSIRSATNSVARSVIYEG